MLIYTTLKTIHFVSAAILFMSLMHCMFLWIQRANHHQEKIQQQTWLLIAPTFLVQLLTGFTIISIKNYSIHDAWIEFSIYSYIFLIFAWFTFIYCLLTIPYRRNIQRLFLLLCLGIIFAMVFFMTNRAI